MARYNIWMRSSIPSTRWVLHKDNPELNGLTYGEAELTVRKRNELSAEKGTHMSFMMLSVDQPDPLRGIRADIMGQPISRLRPA